MPYTCCSQVVVVDHCIVAVDYLWGCTRIIGFGQWILRCCSCIGNFPFLCWDEIQAAWFPFTRWLVDLQYFKYLYSLTRLGSMVNICKVKTHHQVWKEKKNHNLLWPFFPKFITQVMCTMYDWIGQISREVWTWQSNNSFNIEVHDTYVHVRKKCKSLAKIKFRA